MQKLLKLDSQLVCVGCWFLLPILSYVCDYAGSHIKKTCYIDIILREVDQEAGLAGGMVRVVPAHRSDLSVSASLLLGCQLCARKIRSKASTQDATMLLKSCLHLGFASLTYGLSQLDAPLSAPDLMSTGAPSSSRSRLRPEPATFAYGLA